MTTISIAAPAVAEPALAQRPEVRAPRPGRLPLLLLAAYTLFVPLFAARNYYVNEQRLGRPSWWRALGVSAFEVYVWAVLCLGAWWLARRYPLDRGGWRRGALAFALGGLVLASFRSLTEYWFTGWLNADFGVPPDFAFYETLSRFPSGLMFSYTLVGMMHGLEYFRRLRERELAAARLEGELSRARLRALKAHLQPHFLFNALNTVASLVRRDPEAAEEMIGDLSDLLRASLAHEHTQEVTLREELATLEPYLRIQQARFGERLEVVRRVEASALDARVPHLVLQPLVENAMRHGVARRPGRGRVEVCVGREGGVLRLRVADNGPGFPLAYREGVGLGSTRARLRHLYGGERLTIRPAPGGGAVVELELPFRRGGGAPGREAA
ncbi:MAG TPA: histidine kinase [Longimicrobium sp.]